MPYFPEQYLPVEWFADEIVHPGIERAFPIAGQRTSISTTSNSR